MALFIRKELSNLDRAVTAHLVMVKQAARHPGGDAPTTLPAPGELEFDAVFKLELFRSLRESSVVGSQPETRACVEDYEGVVFPLLKDHELSGMSVKEIKALLDSKDREAAARNG